MTEHLHRSTPSGDSSSENKSQSMAEAQDPTTPDLALDIQTLQILDSSDDGLLGIQDIKPFLNISWTEIWQGADQQKTLQTGFQTHITKPVDPEALLAAIVSLLRSDR